MKTSGIEAAASKEKSAGDAMQTEIGTVESERKAEILLLKNSVFSIKDKFT